MKKKIIGKVIASMLALSCALSAPVIPQTTYADDMDLIYEFEDGNHPDSKVQEDSEASGGKYVFLENNSESISVNVSVPDTGMYDIIIRYSAPYGEKIQNLLVNGVDQGQISLTSKEWTELKVLTAKLNKGENEITIKGSWGWTNFDYVLCSSAELPDITGFDRTPVDKNATDATKRLMAYLSDTYGNHIISGQQEIYSGGPHGLEQEFEYLKETTGHYPAIRGFDYGNFCCPAYGSDDGSTKRILEWVNERNGIATASFHLNVPTEFANYTIGSKMDWAQTTYSEKTDFSPSKAATEGTKENEYLMQSLEVLAKEFKTLEAADVPVIWRPYHEAEGSGGEEGSWFWWGREGSEAYKKLWIYTYKVLTEKFDCHNLIWEWNSYNYESSPNWYPGDDYVDIIGYDKYSCTVYLEENGWQPSLIHNDSPVSGTFYGIVEKYNGKKMVSMAENDCFSTVDNLTSEKAAWLYFCTWYDGGSDNINFLSNPMFNTKEDTIAMYQSEYCITLDELPDLKTYESGNVTPTKPTESTTEPEPTTEVTTAETTEPTILGDYFEDVRLEYDSSPMKVGETREVVAYKTNGKKAVISGVHSTSTCISIEYTEGSNILYITALAPGLAGFYVSALECDRGDSGTIEIIDDEPVTTVTTATSATTTVSTQTTTKHTNAITTYTVLTGPPDNPNFAMIVAYGDSTMVIGEKKAVTVYNAVPGLPYNVSVVKAYSDSPCISIEYTEGSDVFYITALEAGKAEFKVDAELKDENGSTIASDSWNRGEIYVISDEPTTAPPVTTLTTTSTTGRIDPHQTTAVSNTTTVVTTTEEETHPIVTVATNQVTVPTSVKATKYGDVNNDGNVNVSDVVALNLFLLNSNKYELSAVGAANADCVKDGMLNSSDSTILMNFIAEITDYSELGK